MRPYVRIAARVREDSGEGRARRLLIEEAGGIAQLIQLLYSHSDPTMGGVDTYRLMSPQGTIENLSIFGNFYLHSNVNLHTHRTHRGCIAVNLHSGPPTLVIASRLRCPVGAVPCL